MISELAAFAGGVLFGTAGVKALGSKDAKKAYANTAAFGLRVKDSVMKASVHLFLICLMLVLILLVQIRGYCHKKWNSHSY